MPKPVSKRQARYMAAILHGSKKGTSARGDRVPASVAEKYKGGDKDNLPESKGKTYDGSLWGEHSKDKKNSHKEKRSKKEKQSKQAKDLKKALFDFLKQQPTDIGVCVVLDNNGHVLLGKRTDDGTLALPGGHIESGESPKDGTIREVKEETGIQCISLLDGPAIYNIDGSQHNIHIFGCNSFKGKPKDTNELYDVKWYNWIEIPWNDMHPHTFYNLSRYIQDKINSGSMKKSLKLLIANEELKKNLSRQNGPSHVTYEMTHGDALRIVNNGTFRFLKNLVKGMKDESFKNVEFDNYILAIRKHANDIYSGRIIDGHKQIHQFTYKSLPQVAVELMSVFEWYSPEDEQYLQLLSDEELTDDAINGGLSTLLDNYKKHNLGNIYSEMENIRSEIRSGNTIDIQQVEKRIMVLFDRLDETVTNTIDKHNSLVSEAGSAIDELESKLHEMQAKIDELSKKPTKIEAIATKPEKAPTIYNDYYSYLTRPKIEIAPNGKISISFENDWTSLDQENFLNDVKAKALKKSRG